MTSEQEPPSARASPAVLAVVALAPTVLIFVNRRQLLGVANREAALRAELQGLVGSLGELVDLTGGAR